MLIILAAAGVAQAQPASRRARVAASPAAAFVTVPPTRVVDTRTGRGGHQVAPHTSTYFVLALDQIAGAFTAPGEAWSAVVLNVTVVTPLAPGYLTVYATPTRPATSDINFAAGHSVANTVITDAVIFGGFNVYNGSSAVMQIVVDVLGYVPAYSGDTPPAGSLVPVAPQRLLDTAAKRTPAYGSVDVPVAGRARVPATGVSAVALNVTAATPAAKGYLTAWPAGSTRPVTSNVSFAAGHSTAGLIIVPVGNDGAISLYNGSPVSTRLVADVVGYVTTAGSGSGALAGSYHPLTPARILDTRSGLGGHGTSAARATTVLSPLGHGGVPAGDVSAVLLSVTATAATAPGYVTAWAGGTARPVTSSLSFPAGRSVANLVVAPLGPDGTVDLYNGSDGHTDLIADVAGYLTGGDGATRGSITGRVTAAETGKPLGRIEVRVYTGTDPDIGYRAIVDDADGTYTVGGLAPSTTGYVVCFNPYAGLGENPVAYQAECWNNAWTGDPPPDSYQRVPVTPAAATSVVDAALTPHSTTATITGLVTAPDGSPVAGVEVNAYDYDEDDFVSTANRVTTGADGRYTMSVGPYYRGSQGFLSLPGYFLCFDASNARAGTSPTGYRNQCFHGEPGAYDDNSISDSGGVPTFVGRATTANIQLSISAAVTGQVTAADGSTPVAGIRVGVISTTGVGTFYTSTGADGTWRVANADPDTDYVICFDSRYRTTGTGYVPQCYHDKPFAWANGQTPSYAGLDTVHTSTGQTITRINAALATGAALTGTVRSTTGKPVAGRYTSVRTADGKPTPYGSLATAANGTYTVRDLPPSSTGYLITDGDVYYPGSATAANAQPVPVQAGHTTTGVDLVDTP